MSVLGPLDIGAVLGHHHDAGAVEVGEDVDLSRVPLPADLAAAVEGETEAGIPKKKPTRAKRAPVKAE